MTTFNGSWTAVGGRRTGGGRQKVKTETRECRIKNGTFGCVGQHDGQKKGRCAVFEEEVRLVDWEQVQVGCGWKEKMDKDSS